MGKPVLIFALALLCACQPAADTGPTAEATQTPIPAVSEGASGTPIAAAAIGVLEGDAQQQAHCRLSNDYGMKVDRDCLYLADGEGFSLSLPGEAPIADNILSVSLYPAGEGQMEVRGLTAEGIDSRWGRAQISADDADCWIGADFKVCAELAG